MRIRKYGRHAVLMRKARQRYRKNGAKLCSNERGPGNRDRRGAPSQRSQGWCPLLLKRNGRAQ